MRIHKKLLCGSELNIYINVLNKNYASLSFTSSQPGQDFLSAYVMLVIGSIPNKLGQRKNSRFRLLKVVVYVHAWCQQRCMQTNWQNCYNLVNQRFKRKCFFLNFVVGSIVKVFNVKWFDLYFWMLLLVENK